MRTIILFIVFALVSSLLPAGAQGKAAGSRTVYSLKLDPPVLVERGLGPNGPAMSPAKIELSVSYIADDRLEGSAGYGYSDCGLHGGGRVEGIIKKNRLDIKIVDKTGQPLITLAGCGDATGGFSGQARVVQPLPGSYGEVGKGLRRFELRRLEKKIKG
ncbi:MAG: hypothetical protein AB7W16_03870 [Candidatus Obscuribacterales bacterium]